MEMTTARRCQGNPRCNRHRGSGASVQNRGQVEERGKKVRRKFVFVMRMVSQAIGRIKVRATRKTEYSDELPQRKMERIQTVEFSTDHGWFNRKRHMPGLHGLPRWNRPLEKAIIIVVFPGRQHRRCNFRMPDCVIQENVFLKISGGRGFDLRMTRKIVERGGTPQSIRPVPCPAAVQSVAGCVPLPDELGARLPRVEPKSD